MQHFMCQTSEANLGDVLEDWLYSLVKTADCVCVRLCFSKRISRLKDDQTQERQCL